MRHKPGKRALIFATAFAKRYGKAHIRVDPRHIQPLKHRYEIGIVQRIEDDEARINRHFDAVEVSIDRMAVTTDTAVPFEDMDICMRMKKISGRQARNA